MDTNPYRATDEVDGSIETPSKPVAGKWLFAFSAGLVLAVAFSVASDGAGVVFWLALLVGIPVLSFMASHARRKNRIATAVAGCLVGIAGIIAFFPICTGTWAVSGLPIHSVPVETPWIVLIFSGSIASACAVVVLLHHNRGIETDDKSD